MKVKIKKLSEDAVIPSYAKESDAGLDLTATSVEPEGMNLVYGTGLAFEIPEGHVGLIFPRSSVAKTGLTMRNAVGVLDAGYRGEVKLKFLRGVKPYKVGDRIGQLIIMPFPKVEFEEVDELSETDRGSGGFGSTNK